MDNFLESLNRIGNIFQQARSNNSNGLVRLHLMNALELLYQVLMDLVELVENIESIGEEVNDGF